MATYILLGTLTDEGAEKLRAHPEWIEEVNRDLEKMGVTVIAQYAVLGPYDLVNIVEAPDNKSVVRVSTQLTLQRWPSKRRQPRRLARQSHPGTARAWTSLFAAQRISANHYHPQHERRPAAVPSCSVLAPMLHVPAP